MSIDNPSTQILARRSRRPIDVHVGTRIRSRRRALGLSRSDLAAALELSIQQVQKYETGDSTVAASRLHAIARQLAVDVGYFFDELPAAVESTALPRAPRPLCSRPSSREVHHMVQAYRGILDPELRHQLHELARSLSCVAKREVPPTV